MHGWNEYGHMGWMTGWISMWWIFGAILLAVVVSALIKAQRSSTGWRSDSPEEILKRRLAKGEIDHETYQQTRKALKSSPRL